MVVHLNLHRRHNAKCSAGRPKWSLSVEAEETKRGAKRCSCPIIVSGTLENVFRRQATRARDWDRARAVAQAFLDAGSWTAPKPAPPPPATPPAKPGVTITAAIDRCLKKLRGNSSAEATLAKYTTVLRGADGLEAFAQREGLALLKECERDKIRLLSESWEVSPGTRRTKLSVLKPFFEPYVEDGLFPSNPARFRLTTNRAIRTASQTARLPFSEPEMNRQLEGCEEYGVGEIREWPKKKDGRQVVAITDRREYARKFDGEDMADFIEISVETGLRFMDVATFHIDRLTAAGEVKLRAEKNNAWVSVWIPVYLQNVIRERAKRFGPYIFGDPRGRRRHDVYLCWYRRLNQLWEQTGPWEEKPTHHRYRHTFVRRLLERGTPVNVVAHLIGDSEETVRKHYSQWVPELQAHVTETLQRAHAGRPRFRRALAPVGRTS